MRLDDLVEMENLADLNAQPARCDLIDQFLKGRPHEVFRFSGVGGQTDRGRDLLAGVGIGDLPPSAMGASLKSCRIGVSAPSLILSMNLAP